MDLMKLGIFVVALLALMWFVAPMVGITGAANIAGFSISMSLLLGLSILFTVDYFGWFKVIPLPIPRNFLLIAMVALWASTAYFGGFLSGFLGHTATIAGNAACVVPDAIRGTSSTLNLNAWNMEAASPYTSAIDLTTSCYVIRTKADGTKQTLQTSDTSAGTLSGFVVGDVIDVNCANSSYYTDDQTGICVDGQQKSIDISAHAVVTEANLALVAYDSTGSTALTAATNTDSADYTMAMGANQVAPIFVKLTVNAANSAYRFGGWGTAAFYNISSVVPNGDVGAYTNIAAPASMKGIALEVNSTSSATILKDYSVYTLNTPVMLHGWDYVKEKFIVTSDPTSDPNGGYGAAARLNGFAIVAKDAANSRGTDGRIYRDVAAHTASAADVGLTETVSSPLGKQDGTLIVVS